MNLIYKSPIDFQCKSVPLSTSTLSVALLRECISHKENLPVHVNFDLYHNGRILHETSKIDSQNDIFLHVALPLKGGKGGFGSMLRAIGAQIEKTTNREACRDLSGRRLRDVNEEKRIKDWIKKQSQKKEEEEKKKKQKLKRLAEMTVPANCQYNDLDFEKTRAEIPDIVEESINYGLQQSSSKTSEAASTKRKADSDEDDKQSTNEAEEAHTSTSNSSSSNNNNNKTKRRKEEGGKAINKQALWLGVDIDSDDSDEDDSSDEETAKKDSQ